MNHWSVLVVGFLVLLPLTPSHARAGSPTELKRLFPNQAEISVDREGLARLILPPEVLAASRPDLSDLRVFDHDDKEVAFVIDSSRGEHELIEATERFAGRVLSLKRESHGSEVEPTTQREVYEIVAPPRAPEAGHWDLVIETDRPRFVREVTIAQVLRDGSVEVLVERAPVFRLDASTRRTRIPLPPLSGERVSVEIEGKEDFYLEPTVRFESSRVFDPLQRTVVPLEEVSRRQRDGRTVIELARPGGLVPDLLQFQTTTGSFSRLAEVWDDGLGRPDVMIGEGRVYRVDARRDVEELTLKLRRARGETLRVEIEDGDSPGLDDLAFSAVVRQPVLVFSLPAAPAGRVSGMLRFGGGRAHRPRYDLTALLPGARLQLSDGPAVAAARLYDPAELAVAHIGSIGANPLFDTTPALSFAMLPGAEIDVRVFTHRRPITIAPSPEGLSRLRLAPEDIAHSRAELADLRIVDAGARQWPYLLERNARRESIPMQVDGPKQSKRASRYRLRPSVAPLRFDRIRFESDVPFFDRSYRLLAIDDEGNEQVLASGRLIKDARNPKPTRISFSPRPVREFELLIENGDDAPLEIRTVRAEVRIADLFLVAPAGEYALLIGSSEVDAPDYELERVRDVVLAVSSSEAAPGALVANSDFSRAARFLAGDGPSEIFQKVLVWGVLLMAVAVLVVLTLRLARQEPVSSDESESGG